ncbi:MAG: PH domain-containing protein [Aquificota bacterium]|nr:MAG: PH domain-containing protein [Aquificota bacterium]
MEKKDLMNEEFIIYRTGLHWIMVIYGISWGLVGICIILLLGYLSLTFGESIISTIKQYRTLLAFASIFTIIILLLLLAVLFEAISYLMDYKNSEFIITNKRIIIKKDWMGRLSLEMYLNRIESIFVYQSTLGKLLNYGTITIVGVGGTEEHFDYINKPLEFYKKILKEIESVMH